jgi:hypothetical protein
MKSQIMRVPVFISAQSRLLVGRDYLGIGQGILHRRNATLAKSRRLPRMLIAFSPDNHQLAPRKSD